MYLFISTALDTVGFSFARIDSLCNILSSKNDGEERSMEAPSSRLRKKKVISVN